MYDGAIKGGRLNRYLTGVLTIGLVATGCNSTAVEVSPTTAGAQPPQSTTVTAGPDATMEISSPAFEHQTSIPQRHSCDGDDVSPQLDVANLPDDAVSLVLVMDDPDAPAGTWDHWVAYDIAPIDSIAEGDHDIGIGGVNSWGTTGYGGPCPPSGTHHYFFQVYALDVELGLAEGATKAEVIAAMDGHIIDRAQLVGLFSRS
jgi:Raf kinase inhibitor-like YbhB/YbcL family protein